MAKVYIASSLKNHELNVRIERTLVRLGYECFLPQRDAVQPDGSWRVELTRVTSQQNSEAIAQTDHLLAVGKNIGNDSSWEVGFAKALNKSVMLLFSEEDKVEEHPMLWHSADIRLETRSYRDVEAQLERGFERIKP